MVGFGMARGSSMVGFGVGHGVEHGWVWYGQGE
jgi:hypothetical protein